MTFDPIDTQLSRSPDEALAFIEGQLAMMSLASRGLAESRDFRISQLHKLRCAARIDPNSAYNLGNYFSQSLETSAMRPRRKLLAIRLFERAIEMGMDRLDDPSQPFSKTPKAEHDLRDIISRSLTNIGAKLANDGRPDLATRYFQQSVQVFHGNANSHVCLGNMGVYFPKETRISPLDGIRAWDQAAKLGTWCHESEVGCPCRENAIRIARQVTRDYGKVEGARWVSERYAVASERKSGKLFKPIARSPDDIKRITGKTWSAPARKSAEILAHLLEPYAGQPLELKVTVAAGLLGSLCRLDTLYAKGNPMILTEAMEECAGFEPLRPFIGDEEWQDLGPPETLYLMEEKVQRTVFGLTKQSVVLIADTLRGISSKEAVLGMMFNLDQGFRGGVSSMVRRAVAEATVPIIYVPATMVGRGPRH